MSVAHSVTDKKEELVHNDLPLQVFNQPIALTRSKTKMNTLVYQQEQKNHLVTSHIYFQWHEYEYEYFDNYLNMEVYLI